jgi:hypothetical protein
MLDGKEKEEEKRDASLQKAPESQKAKGTTVAGITYS